MRAIVAVDKNWGIGYKGQLLIAIPEDLKNFKQLTIGKTIIYGRKTLETFPKRKPLPGRRNIILSTDTTLEVENAEIAHSKHELEELIKDIPTEEVCLIGGASVYAQYIDMCDEAIVTFIDKAFDADVYFPNLDEIEGWFLETESEVNYHDTVPYTYRVYKKR